MTGFREASGSASIPQQSNPPVSTEAPTAPTAAATASGRSGLDIFVGHLFAPPIVIPPARAWLVLSLAYLLAVWTDVLFYDTGLGVNVTLWFTSIAGATVFAARRLGRHVPADRVAMMAAAVALSAVPAIRDAGALQFFSLVAALALVGIGVGLPPDVGVRRMSPVAFVIALVSCATSLLT